MSQMNSASFILNGKKVDIAAKDLMSTAKPYFVVDGYDFVAYPNRNSVPFREFYKIPEAETVIRGTLRYEGNPTFIKAFADAGWLDTEEKVWLKPGMTWANITQRVTGAADSSERYTLSFRCSIGILLTTLHSSALIASTKEKCRFPSETESDRITSGMRYFGLFSSEEATIREGNLLDTLCGQLEKLLSFQPGERDLLMLQHKFVVEWEDGQKVSDPPSQTSCQEMATIPYVLSSSFNTPAGPFLFVERHELTELFRKLSPLRLNCWEIRKGTQECRSPLE